MNSKDRGWKTDKYIGGYERVSIRKEQKDEDK
jgi:hypothetical protein